MDLLTLGAIISFGSLATIVYTLLVLVGVAPTPWEETSKGVHEEVKKPTTKLISTEYGEDYVTKIDDSPAQKTLFYLRDMDRPIEQIKMGENCFPLHEMGGYAGDLKYLIHLGENFENSTLRKKLNRGVSREQKEKMSEMRNTIRRLRRENKKLRKNAKEYLADTTDTIKTINKNTSAGFAHFREKGDKNGRQQR